MNFSYSFQPLYYFSRVFGMQPFTILRTPSGDISGQKISFMDFIWFLISTTVFVALAHYTSRSIPHFWDHSSRVSLIGDQIVSTGGFLFSIVFICLDLFNRNRFIEILRKFDKFDKEVLQFGIFIDHKRIRSKFIQLYLSALVVIVFMSAASIYFFEELRELMSITKILLFVTCTILQHIMITTIMVSNFAMLSGLCVRFEKIESALRLGYQHNPI